MFIWRRVVMLAAVASLNRCAAFLPGALRSRAGARQASLAARRALSAKQFSSASAAFAEGGFRPRGGATWEPRSALFSTATDISQDSVQEAPQHPAYDVVDTQYVKEYGATLWRYEHKKTGAEVLSVSIDDDNKVFGIVFRTPPEDSTGLPHILEHSVLCGSRKFPTKEPFVELLKGSLQTFLNAFTYPDRTCYPVASQNTKDFYNLMNVYLDAVLHPRATSDPKVLKQEGWHYELESKDAPLTYKGVVFNEMKGVYSSPDAIMGRTVQQQLFSDNTYHVDSGGDPRAIPDLTFDDFKNFHDRYYHPSNARVYFYGDDDPLKRLELLDEYLADFDKKDPKSEIAWEKKRSEPWTVKGVFPATEDDVAKGKSNMLSVNWLVNDEPMSSKDQLAMSMLDYLLLNDISSPLYKELVASGLGTAVIGGGLSSELLQSTFSVGLKGVAADDVEKVEKLVLDTLKKIKEEGFPADAINACVNSVEFSLREFNTGSFPRGLSFMLGAMREWIYDGEPAEGVRFERALEELKKDIAESGDKVFTDMLGEYLVDNGHRLTMEMAPDTDAEKKALEEEAARLQAAKDAMSDADLDGVIAEMEELKAAQMAEDSAEAKASIPALSIDDLERKAKTVPIEVKDGINGGSTKLITHELPSNGILYADVGLDLSQLSLEQLTLLPLFSDMVMECGTADMDEVQMTRRINGNTGGVRTAVVRDLVENEDGSVTSGDEIVHYLFLRGKAVPDKISDLFSIFNDLLTSANLDRQSRVVEMLKESKASLESSIVSAGHSYAATRLAARDTGLGVLREKVGGISYLETVKALLEEAENDFDALRERLVALRDAILDADAMVINLTGDAAVLEKAAPAAESFAKGIPAKGAITPAPGRVTRVMDLSGAERLPDEDEAIVVPTQVNYVGMAGRIFEEGEQVHTSSMVANNFLRTGHLWDSVRVMGGAYGAMAAFDRLTGRFGFLSYRDPNLLGTIDNYKASAPHLLEAELPRSAVEQAVIGSIGDLDSPLSVDSKGWASMCNYFSGRTDEQRQKRRDEVLETTEANFRDFGARLQKLNEAKPSIVVIGSAKAVEEANEKGAGLKVVNVL